MTSDPRKNIVEIPPRWYVLFCFSVAALIGIVTLRNPASADLLAIEVFPS